MIYSREEIETNVRKKMQKLFRESGLLEYACPKQNCETQIFTTWQVDVTCNRCGKRLRTRGELDGV